MKAFALALLAFAWPAAAQAPVPQRLSDAQILQALKSADDAEIAAARLALQRAYAQPVSSFADRMIHDHGALDGKIKALSRSLGAGLQESSESRRLDAGGERALAGLRGLAKGPDFDRTYVNEQVEEHRSLLDEIDERLAPAVRNPRVATLVGKARDLIAAHLAAARQLQAGLQGR